jgi:tyrosine decarboxylase / aspartate 1-decarboxylase
MREKGCSRDEILAYLERRRGEDCPSCTILSSMCTDPHPMALEADTLFRCTNLGDPGLFPGTAEIERQLVARLGSLMHHPGAGGYATSGGTESNIQALRIARKMKPVKRPNAVIPESAHFSFDKACEMLGVEMRIVPLDGRFRMDAEAADALVDRNTIAICGVAGTTEYGMVDPIARLSEIAEETGIFLHVDAAFGGMVIPFLANPLAFDFALPGVSSISVDPHKMGMSTIPAGCFLVRDQGMLDLLNIPTPYLTVKQEYTLAGTRPGGPVAAAFAVLEYLGREGMEAIVEGCMANTRRLIAGMEVLGIPVVTMPDVNVAAFACDRVPEGWRISRTRRGHLRLVCMPHVSRSVIESFLSAMGELYA